MREANEYKKQQDISVETLKKTLKLREHFNTTKHTQTKEAINLRHKNAIELLDKRDKTEDRSFERKKKLMTLYNVK